MDTIQEKEGKSEGDFSLSAISSTLQKQKRILDELKNEANVLPKKLKTEDSDRTEEESHDVKIECQQAVDEFKKLKLRFIQLKSRTELLNYLENVPREQWPSATSCDEESKKVRRVLKDAKTTVSDLEEHLQEMMEQMQTIQETLDVKLDSLSKLMDDVTEGAAEMEQHLQRIRGGALSGLEGSGINMDNFQEIFNKQDEEFKSAKEFLARYGPLMKSLREEAESLSKKRRQLTSQRNDTMEELSRQIADKSQQEKRQSDQMKWCELASKMLTELSGVSERSFADNCWSLALDTAGCGPNATEGMTALLSLHFKPGPEAWPDRQLTSATIDSSTLEISDLVAEAVRRNDVAFLVSSVMKRLKTHAPLFMEVEQLRHQYAIDWVPEEGILRAIFGDSAQIVCTLSLAAGPQGATVARLKSIEGVGEHPPVEEFKPTQEVPRISDWLDYLHETVKTL